MSSPSEAINDADHDFSIQLSTAEQLLDERNVNPVIQFLEREAYSNKARLDTINSLTAVGAFIAGVQAQLIVVTYPSRSTALDRATNGFGFVGLTLDLVGVSTGVIHALRLQQASRHTDRVTVWLTSTINSARRDVKKLRQRTDLSVYASDLEVYGRLKEKMFAIDHVTAVLIETFSRPSLGSVLTTALKTISSIVPTFQVFKILHIMLNILIYVIRHSLDGPVVSLADGTLCLLISVILFAGASQPLVICISCITITMSMIVLSIPSTKGNKQMRAVYDPVEKDLPGYLLVNPSAYQDPQGRDAQAISTRGQV